MRTTIESLNSLNKVVAKTTFFVLALFFLFGLSITNIEAASFQVSPVRANLSATEKTSVFEFHNTADEEVTVQVDIKKWLQENGVDKYQKTRDVVAVPSIFKMSPGKKQIVRIALLKPQASDKELAYRIFFTELPNLQDKNTMKVKMRLRISVPIFITPNSELSPSIQMSTLDLSNKTIRINNPSNQHVQVLQFLLYTETGEEVASSTGGYLLPGQGRVFELNIPDGTNILKVSADTDTAGLVEYAGSQ